MFKQVYPAGLPSDGEWARWLEWSGQEWKSVLIHQRFWKGKREGGESSLEFKKHQSLNSGQPPIPQQVRG